jgi:hypothetical protein
MSKPAHRRSILGLCVAASLVLFAPLGILAKGTTSTSVVPLTATMYDALNDEQTGLGCTITPAPSQTTRFISDSMADTTASAWDVFPGPWTAVSGIGAGIYDNGTFGNPSSFLRVEFNTSDKNFSIDTRNTTSTPKRMFTLDFTKPYSPASNVPPFGTALSVPALFQVQGLSAITGMSVCTSTDCPESRVLAGHLWWDDPTDSSVQWRVDWGGVRVLRITQQTWYFIASGCGGTQVAGLSELIGNRTQPRVVNKGYYLMPLFIKATLK